MNLIITNNTKNQINKKAISDLIENLLLKYKINGIIELNIHIIGVRRMQKINLHFRGIDKVTDVLSFGQPNLSKLPKSLKTKRILGDIFVCYSRVISQAKNPPAGGKISPQQELLFLINHGFKHLIGIHHKE